MPKKAITCPNCNGPVTPNAATPTISCGYCNHHFDNPYYRARKETNDAPTPPQIGAAYRLLPIVAVAGVVIVVGAVTAISTSFRGTETPRTSTPFAPRPVASPVPTDTPQAVSPEVALENKLKPYIACLYQVYPAVKQSMERYDDWVDMTKGPTCKERYVSYGLYQISPYATEQCQKNVTEANAASPQIPGLQQAASEYVNAGNAIAPVVNAAKDYYEKKHYKLDDCQKGKLYHQQMIPLFQNLSLKYTALLGLLSHHGKGTLDRCLRRTAANPAAVAAYQWAAFIKVAGEMLEVFRAESKKKTPDTALIKAHVKRLTDTQTALDAVADAYKEAAGFAHFEKRAVDELVKSAIAFLSSNGGTRLSSSARFFIRNGSARASQSGAFEHLAAQLNAVLETFEDNTFCGALLRCEPDRCLWGVPEFLPSQG